MSLEMIAIIYAVIVWFFIEMWKNSKKEVLRIFYMIVAFIHVIGGSFIAYGYADSQNLEYLKTIFHSFMLQDVIIFLITWILIILLYTERGVKLLQWAVGKLK